MPIGTPGRQGLLGKESLGEGGSTEERIRRGLLFHSAKRHVNVSNNATEVSRILTGAHEVYLKVVISVEGLVRFRLKEDATFSDGGTAMTISNRNRNSSLVAGSLPFSTATASDEGTVVGIWTLTSTFRNIQEFLLKPSTEYFLDFKNQSGFITDIAVEFEIYERGLDLV